MSLTARKFERPVAPDLDQTAATPLIPASAANRVRHNFSAGPGALPESVLNQAARALIAVPEIGLSLLGISHRSPWFRQLVDEAEAHIRALLDLPPHYHVLFLQGGGTLQFSMIPMAFLRGRSTPAAYLKTGYWSAKSILEAKREGDVSVLFDGATAGYTDLPDIRTLAIPPDAAYFHYVSNETVEGLQFHDLTGPDGANVPYICDMSSDFLSRPVDISRFQLIYAHAQKNLGPAGVTVVLIDDALLAQATADVPAMLDYRRHATEHSIFNTPPVFAIYVVTLVLRWLRSEAGGVAGITAANQTKAATLYRHIDDSDGFYHGRAQARARSRMNVVFNLPTAALEQRFIAEAEAQGLHGLGGHRSLGGLRASLYNAVSLEAVEQLVAFMDAFRRRHG